MISALKNWQGAVEIDGKKYTFHWGKEETRTAILVAKRNGVYVRLRWTDDEQDTFFELRVSFNEMTREHTLVITDFAEKNEEKDQKDLWNSQIESLKRLSGM